MNWTIKYVQDCLGHMETEIDRIPVSQLPARYDIARSAVYTRLKDLKIEAFKQNRKAYLNGEQLKLLDRLHFHIQKGGTTGAFLKLEQEKETRQIETAKEIFVQDSPEQIEASSGQISLTQPGTIVTLVEEIIQRIVPLFGSQLSYLRELEEAYEKGWLLSTSEIASLLKLSPKTLRKYGAEFEDAGFVFTRAGTRKRGEIAWAISKKEDLELPVNNSTVSLKDAFSSDYDP